MELKPNMYVRTRLGIGKITEVHYDEYEEYYFYLTDNGLVIGEDNLVKEPSHNIIDLIEVGDILEINNEKYEVIYDESYEKLGILIPSRKELSIRHSALEYLFEKYNVSIVTKEQFERMKYSLEG